ncbi:hypothetical protein C9374_008468 [Naegleria lovaniensis]|uniref:Uncharacterized protein n=1 Tax=Naegleria lovaniensis TaxID=51637 RepID=A0AA88KG49_NAELO|nr:uncharacterized protein C9374_008468 [Naegleria lovaniensis]KAG2378325.1 hypothetical protein C9374_008468 [Naegleria lovaniensis]
MSQQSSETELDIPSDIIKLICSEYLAPLPTLFLYQRVCKSWQQSLITVLEEQGSSLFRHIHFGINKLTPLLAIVKEDIATTHEEEKHKESSKKKKSKKKSGTNVDLITGNDDEEDEKKETVSVPQRDSDVFILDAYLKIEIKKNSHTYFHSFLDSLNKFGIGKHVEKITLPSIRISNELIYLLCKYFFNLQQIVFALCEPASHVGKRGWENIEWQKIGLELSKDRLAETGDQIAPYAPYSIKRITFITHESIEDYDYETIMCYLLDTFIKNEREDFYDIKESRIDWLHFIDLFEYDDPTYVSLLKSNSIEKEIPIEYHIQRFLIDMSPWDDVDDEEFDETYIHPMVNILTENWKGDIEHFYKNNVLSIHQVLSPRLGYNIGHALATSLWTNLNENINQKRITAENVTKWRNSQKVKDVLEGLKYLISRGLDVVRKQDKFKGLTIIEMIRLSDELVKKQGWSICPALLDEVKDMIRLHSFSNEISDVDLHIDKQATKKKRKKKEEEYEFEADSDDEEPYEEEEEEDYSPKKKKTKKAYNTRKTSSTKTKYF